MSGGRIGKPGKTGKIRTVGKPEYTRYEWSVREILVWSCEGALLCLALDFLFYRSLLMIVIFPPVIYMYLQWRRRGRMKKLKQEMSLHFKDFLQALETSMKAGYSLENSIGECEKDMRARYGEREPLVRELRFMRGQLLINVPVERLFEDFGKRCGIEDIRSFAEVVTIAKRTGGSMKMVLEQTSRILCGKLDTKKEIEAAIAAKKYEQTIMNVIPAGIILYMNLTFPGFLDVLYTGVTGRIIMTGCLMVYAASWYMGRKMVEIEV